MSEVPLYGNGPTPGYPDPDFWEGAGDLSRCIEGSAGGAEGHFKPQRPSIFVVLINNCGVQRHVISRHSDLPRYIEVLRPNSSSFGEAEGHCKPQRPSTCVVLIDDCTVQKYVISRHFDLSRCMEGSRPNSSSSVFFLEPLPSASSAACTPTRGYEGEQIHKSTIGSLPRPKWFGISSLSGLLLLACLSA